MHVSLIRLFLVHVHGIPPCIVIPTVVRTRGTNLDGVAQSRLRTRCVTNKRIRGMIRTLMSTSGTGVRLSFRVTANVSLTNHSMFRTIRVSIGPGIVSAPPIATMTGSNVRLVTGTHIAMHTGVHRLMKNTKRSAVLTHINRNVISSVKSSRGRGSMLRGPSSVSGLMLHGNLSTNATFRVLSVSVTSVSVNEGVKTTLRVSRTGTSGGVTRTGTRRHHTVTITLRRRVGTGTRRTHTGMVRTRTRMPGTVTRTFHDNGLNVVSCCHVGGVRTSASVHRGVTGPRAAFNGRPLDGWG